VDDVMRVHFIDVGQGAATLLEFPCAAVLIDTGGERSPPEPWEEPVYDSNAALKNYLDDFFANRRPDLDQKLDLLILTHPHKDHTRGVAHVLQRYSPKSVVHNGQWTGSGIEDQDLARDYARNNSDDEDGAVKTWYVLNRTIGASGLTNPAIDPVTCPTTDPTIRVLWGQTRGSPDEQWDFGDFSDENNHSVVIRVDYGDASILFTGDLEETTRTGRKAGIERLVAKYKNTGLLDVDVYHVGHHGSHNGTTPALVEAMSPEIAVISSGPACKREGFSAWSHAHPRTVTIEDLEAGVTGSRPAKDVKVFDRHATNPVTRSMKKAIYSTGWDGTVVLEAKPDGSWTAKPGTPDPCLD
jgi:beta-lactamase superfamily II metal-dependent hydrolase